MYVGAALSAIALALTGWVSAPVASDPTSCAVTIEIRNHTADPVTIDWGGSGARITKTWPGGRPEGMVVGLGADATAVPAASRTFVARTLPVACDDLRQISARVEVETGSRGGDVWFEQTQRWAPGIDPRPMLNVHRWHPPHRAAAPAAACALPASSTDAPD